MLDEIPSGKKTRELLGFLHCLRVTNNACHTGGSSSILETRVCLVTSIRAEKRGIGGSVGRWVGEVSYFLASVEFELHESPLRANAPSLYFDKRDHKSTGAAVTRATKFPRR